MTTDDAEPVPDGSGHTEPARVVDIVGPLPEPLALAVDALAALTAETDGVAPLDDDARLGLRQLHTPPRRHLLAMPPTPRPEGDREPGPGPLAAQGPPAAQGHEELVGYAQVDPVAAQVALFVAPRARRTGVGSTLLAAAADALDDPAFDHPAPDHPAPDHPAPDHGALSHRARWSGWAHGDLPSATAFARHHGLVATRRLLQLRRTLTDTHPTGSSPAGVGASMPAGYRLRAFVPGQDDDGWVALNAAAFVDLPDQGGMTRADLAARMRESWFDPAGLLLAETTDGRLAGFHWTKVHPSTEDDPTPAGEVYVLGVHPDHQRTGLGGVLLAAGLEHLRERGMRRVLLYVDAANAPAVRLYERLGFAVHRTDTLYSAPR